VINWYPGDRYAPGDGDNGEGLSVDHEDEVHLRDHVAAIIALLGYDLEDQHFRDTPKRVTQVLSGFRANADFDAGVALLDAQFDDEHDSLVATGPIAVRSMCAHHMLPVTGRAWVGYLPNAHVCGLSKMARVVHHFAQQYTVQERVTQQVADCMMAGLKPAGVMIVIEAEHGCMSLRGVLEPDAVTITSAVRGVFRENAEGIKDEFLQLIRRS
jgi:GTP cyclohydrolase IA